MEIKLEIDVLEINKITQKLGDIKFKAQDICTACEGIRLILKERDTGELLQSMTVDGHPYNIYATTESSIVIGK